MDPLSILQTLFNTTWGVLLVILLVNGTIYFHELGHYLAARWRGLRVERFSLFGIGPKIVGWRGKDGVEYCICWLPIGAYVALPQLSEMKGIEGDTSADRPDELPPLSFTDKVVVAAAGPFFNVILGLVLATVLWFTGYPESSTENSSVIGYVSETLPISETETVPAPAYVAGLLPGDEILRIDGQRVEGFGEITQAIVAGTGRDAEGNPQAEFEILRDGETLNITLHPALPQSKEGLRTIGIMSSQPSVVGQVQEHSPAAVARLEPGDEIVSVNGQRVYSYYQLLDMLEGLEGELLPLEIQRNGETITRMIRPASMPVAKPLLRVGRADRQTTALELLPHFGEEQPANPDAPTTAASIRILPAEGAPAPFNLLRLNDTLTQIGDTKISSLAQAREALAQSPEAGWLVERNGQRIRWQPTVPLQSTLQQARYQTDLGIQLSREGRMVMVYKNPVAQIGEHLDMTFLTLNRLFNPQSDIGVRHLMGMVYMVPSVYRLVNFDVRLAIWFAVLININLAIINLLPIPVLDGGHITLATLQKLRGKPLPPNFIMGLQSAFTILLLGLMLFVLYNDSMRLAREGSQANRYERQLAYQLDIRYHPEP